MTIAHQFATAFASIPPGLLGMGSEEPKIAKPQHPAPAQPRRGLRRGDAAALPDQTIREGWPPGPGTVPAAPHDSKAAKAPPRKLLSFRQLKEERGITFSRRHLYTLEAERKFPRRVLLGDNRVGWVVSELDAWLDAKLAERDAA